MSEAPTGAETQMRISSPGTPPISPLSVSRTTPEFSVHLQVRQMPIRQPFFGDSPAASATLGQSMVTLKLSVFMLSAAIAGVGGALMTAQIGSANLDRFDIFLSLSLLMLTVVAGIGYVSGALMGGLLFGVFFVALQSTFDKLGADYPDFEGFVLDGLHRVPRLRVPQVDYLVAPGRRADFVGRTERLDADLERGLAQAGLRVPTRVEQANAGPASDYRWPAPAASA